MWERQFEVHPGTELGMSIYSSKRGLLLSVFMDDIKMAGKKHNVVPMWKKLMKHLDLDEPKSFLHHVYLGFTQRERKPN